MSGEVKKPEFRYKPENFHPYVKQIHGPNQTILYT